MGKSTNKSLWAAANPPVPIADIAGLLEISPARVRQVVSALKMKPVARIGNVPFYSHFQFLLIRNRNTKPGPKKPLSRNGKSREKKR